MDCSECIGPHGKAKLDVLAVCESDFHTADERRNLQKPHLCNDTKCTGLAIIEIPEHAPEELLGHRAVACLVDGAEGVFGRGSGRAQQEHFSEAKPQRVAHFVEARGAGLELFRIKLSHNPHEKKIPVHCWAEAASRFAHCCHNRGVLAGLISTKITFEFGVGLLNGVEIG